MFPYANARDSIRIVYGDEVMAYHKAIVSLLLLHLQSRFLTRYVILLRA